MLVVIKHAVSNMPNFLDGVHSAANNLPDSVTIHHMITNRTGDCAFCLIEGNALEEVRDFVEHHVGEHCDESEYHEVHDEQSVGLPS